MNNKLQRKGVIVWLVCALFFLYEFLLRTVIGADQATIMHDLKLTSFQFSLLSTTVFLLTYGIMQIPAGLIVDNIGLKKSLLIGAFCCSISSVVFAYSKNYNIALISRVAMGFGASFGFITLLVSIYEWMPRKYLAIFIGISQFIGTLGPMLATGPLETLLYKLNIDWRYIFLFLGALGAILIFFIFIFVDNNREYTGEYVIIYKPEKIITSISRLFARSQPWYIAFLCASLYFSIEYLSENEGRTFLLLKGISSKSAGYMLTVSWIGYAIGCPLLGLLSDILEKRKIILNCCSLLALISITMIIYLTNKTCLQLAFFILGISASGQSIGFAIMSEQFKKQFIAVGFGLNNMIITTISAINAPIIGLLLDQAHNEKPLSLDSYVYVFNILIIIALTSVALSTIFIKETFCKSVVDFTVLKNHHN